VRYAVLLVLLAGAAFLGGTYVDRARLEWAEKQLSRYLGGARSESEIASVELRSTAAPEAVSAGPPLASVNAPAAVMPPPTVQNVTPTSDPPDPPRQRSPQDPKVERAAFGGAPAPATRVPAKSSSSPPSTPVLQPLGSVRGGDDEWPVLEREMKALGVSRFTIEAEPGGRVTFSCLVPMVGSQAVAQRFEAEGEELIPVIRAALRRIVLWQATDGPQPER
jgi:hypothetical protein